MPSLKRIAPAGALPLMLLGALITSTLQGWVLRPGAEIHLIWYPYPSTDPGPWKAFRAILASGSDTPKFRICYCSAFNQCWLTDGHNLDPPRVKICPVPKVAFIR